MEVYNAGFHEASAVTVGTKEAEHNNGCKGVPIMPHDGGLPICGAVDGQGQPIQSCVHREHTDRPFPRCMLGGDSR